jgi:hypothetical protein
VRSVAWGLGSLARNAGLLGVTGVLSTVAGGADAAPAPQVFALTISATSITDFDHTTAPIERLDCETSSRAEGFRTTSFTSTRATLVRFVGGRLQPVVAGGLKGTVKLSGTNAAKLACGGQETQTPQPCPKSKRAFVNGRATLSSAVAGSITIRLPRVALRRIHCPEEPAEVAVLPLGIAPGPLHVQVATLTNPRTTRIALTASARRTTNYATPEAGFVKQRTAWKLTFLRVGPD